MAGKIKVVCPSKGRASTISTTRFVDDLILVVPEKEVDEYKEYNPSNEVIAEPKHVRNIVSSRQFILDKFDDVFMLDDDVLNIRRNYAEEGDPYLVDNPVEVKALIQRAADITSDVGAYMFGFGNIRTPLHYIDHTPFKFTGYLNASYTGYLKGHGLSYDTSYIEGEDHYMSCLNVYKNRYMYIESRYSFVTQGNFEAEGGCQLDRTKDSMLETTLKLRQQFGNVIHIKKPTGGKGKLREGERSVTFPF